jgi:threonine dehydratase
MSEALAVVRRHLPVTPVVAAGDIENVVLKLETVQPTGSFKVRGALVALDRDRDRRAVVAASAGNHGLGVAYAAARLGVAATVVVPETAAANKVAALARFPGLTLVRHGARYDEAEGHAIALAGATGARYLSPYDDPDVIAGQGTVGLELLDQVDGLAAVVVPVGGGGLASGVALAVAGRGLKVIGVEAAQSPAMTAAVAAGHPVPVEVGPTLADGLAGNLAAGASTVAILREHLHDLLTVTEDEIAFAMRALALDHGLVAEGSAAVALAPLLHGRLAVDGTVAVVVTGRNVDPATLVAVLGRRQ